MATGTEMDKRERAVEASNRRVGGHLWLFGAFVASTFIFGALMGRAGLGWGPLLGCLMVLAGAADAVCIGKAVTAYRESGRIRAGKLRRDPPFELLTELRDENDVDGLADLLADPLMSDRARRWVTQVLASTRPGGGSAGLLGREIEPRVIPVLSSLLEDDPDPVVRRSAAAGLWQTGDEAACAALIQALSDADRPTQLNAIVGLGYLRSRAAVAPLSELLGDPSRRLDAARSLVKIRDERALDPMRSALVTENDPGRRRKLEAAVRALEARVGLGA